MKKFSIIFGLLMFPMVALAQTTIQGIVVDLGRILDFATPVVVALALIYFFWGLASFILAAGDEEGRKKGRNVMIWGIIALFVIVSIWGLVRVIQNTFSIEDPTRVNVPGVNL